MLVKYDNLARLNYTFWGDQSNLMQMLLLILREISLIAHEVWVSNIMTPCVDMDF